MRWVMVALRQMYDFSRPQGESCYRLLNKSNQFIYLKTRGFLEIDEKTNTVHSFVCINTLVSEEEGNRLINEMKRHYAVIIEQNERTAVTNYSSDVPAIESPQQLESAIMTLISNLGPSRNLDPYNIPSVESDSSVESECSKNSSSLSIIAPQFNTIKSTVCKSAEVLGTSSNKRFKQTAKINNKSELSAHSTPVTLIERPSVLKMHGSHTHSTPHTTLVVYEETRIKYEPPSPLNSGHIPSPEYRSQSRMIEASNGNELHQKTQNNNLSPQYEMSQQSTSNNTTNNGRGSHKRTYLENEGDYVSKRRNTLGCEEIETSMRVLEDSNNGKSISTFYKNTG